MGGVTEKRNSAGAAESIVAPSASGNELAGDTEKHLANDRIDVVVRHSPRAVLLFAIFALVAGVIEWGTQPAHRPAVATVSILYPLILLPHLAVTRRWPAWSVGSIILAANGLCATTLLYSVMVRGKGELVVLALGILLGTTAIVFPMGARRQLLSSLAALAGYPIALQMGTVLSSSWWYSGIGLAFLVSVLALGAGMLEEYRKRMLLDALRQAELARENARLLEEVRAADQAKNEFISTISHELRTPLSSIVGYADLLLEDAFEAHELHDVERRIREQADLMINLVQALLDLNRIGSGKLRLTIEDFELGEMLERLQQYLPASWRAPGVELRWEGPPAPLSMHSDRGKIEMVVRNLVHNALKYTRQGHVTVHAEALPEAVRITVTDSGEGISAADLPKIFAMFGQGTRTPPRGGGVGLGLHIVKRFTEVLGGTVSVESQADVGTTFTVVLPRHLPEPEEE
jgi:signal transduction histidine kinase